MYKLWTSTIEYWFLSLRESQIFCRLRSMAYYWAVFRFHDFVSIFFCLLAYIFIEWIICFSFSHVFRLVTFLKDVTLKYFLFVFMIWIYHTGHRSLLFIPILYHFVWTVKDKVSFVSVFSIYLKLFEFFARVFMSSVEFFRQWPPAEKPSDIGI